MDKNSEVLSKYDEIKEELKQGILTEKGFDVKVKQLLEKCCHSTSAQNSKEQTQTAGPSCELGAYSLSENIEYLCSRPFTMKSDSNSVLSEIPVETHSSKKLKTWDISDISFSMPDAELKLPEKIYEETLKTDHIGSKNLEPLYYPRLPYVPSEQIKIDDSCILGSGGFGTVYKGTVAAIKKIPYQEEIKADIKHEILVNMRLSHPNIVRLMATSKTENAILMASEYIHGASLDKILHSENVAIKLCEEDKFYISLEILLAVEYIHSQNILHQDIKPANIIIDQKNKKAYLTDWGMAYIRDSVIFKIGSRLFSQKIGPIGGTALYMAPECLLEYQCPTKKTDVWSVGATLLELFCNRKPWDFKTARELCIAMQSQLPPHAMQYVNIKILPIINNCFSYKIDERPSPSDMVFEMKKLEDLNLEEHYGYSW